MKIPIEVNARHIHLSQTDLDKLFGNNYQLTVLKKISQVNQFAACETITIKGPRNTIFNVRIVGPLRAQTQLEITITDSYFLGIVPPPILLSGQLEKSSGGLTICGPKGEVKLNRGVIVNQRHLHIEPEKAKLLNIKDNQIVSIKTTGTRPIIFQNIIVRSNKNKDNLSFQIDTDEANAAGIKSGDYGEIV